MKQRKAILAAAVIFALLALTATALAVLPKAYVALTRPLAGASIAEDTTFTVSGILKPRHSLVVSPSTRVYLYRYHFGSWRLYTSRAARNSNPPGLTYTKFAASTKIPYKGRWMVRAYHKCVKHAPSWSTARYFSVTGRSKPKPTGSGCWGGCH